MKIQICRTCKNKFAPSSGHKDCPKCRYKASKIRCPKCDEPMQRISQVCFRCRLQTGKYNGNWKGGKTNHQGYLMINIPEHPRSKKNTSPYIMEHILVMEKHMGRYLRPEETIHHKNGIKDDNRIENLELWTATHPSGCKVLDLLEWAHNFIKEYDSL